MHTGGLFFTPSVVQWGSSTYCTKFSVWLDCVWLFIIRYLSVSSQCISSAVVCKCLWWHCQVLLGTGVSGYCLRGLGVCDRCCVARIWEFCWFCRWAIWGQVALVPWGIIPFTKWRETGCDSIAEFESSSHAWAWIAGEVWQCHSEHVVLRYCLRGVTSWAES